MGLFHLINVKSYIPANILLMIHSGGIQGRNIAPPNSTGFYSNIRFERQAPPIQSNLRRNLGSVRPNSGKSAMRTLQVRHFD